VGNHLFVFFAVLDVSFAVNSCLNRSFFTFYNDERELDHIHLYDAVINIHISLGLYIKAFFIQEFYMPIQFHNGRFITTHACLRVCLFIAMYFYRQQR